MSDTKLVATPAMAAALGISTRTLHKYIKADAPFIEGRHFRRATPAPQSPWVWDQELAIKAWNAEVASA